MSTVTLREAADLLGIEVWSMRVLLRKHVVPCVRSGKLNKIGVPLIAVLGLAVGRAASKKRLADKTAARIAQAVMRLSQESLVASLAVGRRHVVAIGTEVCSGLWSESDLRGSRALAAAKLARLATVVDLLPAWEHLKIRLARLRAAEAERRRRPEPSLN